MSRYDNCSREELLRRIEELEAQLDTPKGSGSRFRERYACKILDSIPDMLTVLDRDGTLVELVSADETNHVGVPGGELAGQNIRTMLSPAACRNVKNNLDNVFATGCGSSSHHDITLDGRTRNYENRIFPLDGEHALCICRDITEAEAAKHELEMVKYALNNVDEEIYACSLDGTMEYANEQFRVRHDVEGDLSQHKVYDFWSYEGSRLQWEARLAKIRRDNGSHKYTVRFKNEQGRIVAWDIVAYIIYDYFQEREIVWFFGRDVTQRIEHENKVKEMNSILECILNNIPVYLFVKDPGNEFRYLYWNRAFEEYSRIPASRALGHTDYEIFPSPKDAEHFRQDDLTLLRTGERQTFIEEYVSATGETRIVNTSKSLVPVENRLPLIIGVSWDITDMKNAELEIVEARIRAEESDRLKSAFLANMSHEIRTPLTTIIGINDEIAESSPTEEIKTASEKIKKASEHLLSLINDVLDMSKINEGKMELRKDSFDLAETVRAVGVIYAAVASRQGLAFRLESPEGELFVSADELRIRQILINLISNAIKYNRPGGEVALRLELLSTDEKELSVRLSVEDTGIGIKKENLDAIFTEFEQEGRSGGAVKGTGLGLAIASKIAAMLGSWIHVESEPDRGSRFWFDLRLERALPAAETSRDGLLAEDAYKGRKVIVAEDHPINASIVRRMLEKWGIECLMAENGRICADIFAASAPKEIDAILMDIQMPIMTGYEAARAIREMERPDAASVPIIALTANAFDEDASKARAAGMNAHVVKPIDISVLYGILGKFFKGGQR